MYQYPLKIIKAISKQGNEKTYAPWIKYKAMGTDTVN